MWRTTRVLSKPVLFGQYVSLHILFTSRRVPQHTQQAVVDPLLDTLSVLPCGSAELNTEFLVCWRNNFPLFTRANQNRYRYPILLRQQYPDAKAAAKR